MHSLQKAYYGFRSRSYFYVDMLKTVDPINPSNLVFINNLFDDRKVFVESSGVINAIWQAWSGFWRSYWMLHIFGGKGIKGTIPFNTIGIGGITPRTDEKTAIFLLLDSIGKARRFQSSRVVQPHQEPTWGDIDLITNISNQYPNPGIRINSALSVFGNSAKHLQKVRNSSIHISEFGMNDVKINVVPHYRISTIKYPTDVLFAQELRTSKVAITSWVDELVAFLELFYI